DRRLAELTTKLKTLKTDADINEWHRMATALIRDLEKAGLTGAAATLTAALEAGGWPWGADHHTHQFAPGGLVTALSTATRQIQEKIQDLILKDMVSVRDEATPPEFKELVERYFEVLSGGDPGQ